MDLSFFTDSDKKIKKNLDEKKISKKNFSVVESSKEKIYEFKNLEALEKFQNELFMSPTEKKIINSEEELKDFFSYSKKRGVEGVMLKNIDAKYKAGLRVGTMAKIKETKEDLEVVVLGAEYGKGKRAGFYSSFIIGVRNPLYNDFEDEFLDVGKVSSGVKELEGNKVSLNNLTQLLKPLKKGEEKDTVFFTPKVVLQVRYQEIQKTTFTSSKFALRFPRIIDLRYDKCVEDINTIDDLKKFM